MRHVVADQSAWRRGKRAGDPGAFAGTVQAQESLPLGANVVVDEGLGFRLLRGDKPPAADRDSFAERQVRQHHNFHQPNPREPRTGDTAGLPRVARSGLPLLHQRRQPQYALAMS